MNEVTISVARGSGVHARLDELASLRIRVFREWPYLYEGTAEHEREYLGTYVRCPGALVVLATAGESGVVGASTALPLTAEPPEVQAPFLAHGIDPESVFYFGESVLLPEWRGRGIGLRFMEEREKAALIGGYKLAAFCAVERVDHDPRKPVTYKPLYAFWEKRGFQRRPELQTTFSWKEIGESTATPKPMVFWTKDLT